MHLLISFKYVKKKYSEIEKTHKTVCMFKFLHIFNNNLNLLKLLALLSMRHASLARLTGEQYKYSL